MVDNVTRIPAAGPASAALCMTPTLHDIFSVLDYAREQGMMAGIFGPAGVGKTTAINDYAARHDDVYVTRASISTRTGQQLRAAIADDLDLPKNARYEASVYTFLRQRVSAHRCGGLWIIDEAQLLADSGLAEVCYLHDPRPDHDALAIALVGNPVTISLRDGRNRATNGQFLTRCYPRLMLDDTGDDDFEAFFDHHKIAGARPRASVKKAAREHGGLRAASFIIERARSAAGARAIELADIERAIAFLGYT